MWRFKIFLDPINQLETWINTQAQAGYQLTQVAWCFYKFEKSTTPHSYSVQYLGCNPPKDNRNYLRLLAEANIKTFRAPLNQGNLTFLKFRFRPFAKGTAKFANSFQDYNRELIIVENTTTKPVPILTIPQDLEKIYYDIRNTYLWGANVTILLTLLAVWTIVHNLNTNPIFSTIALMGGVISALLCGIYARFALYAQKKFQHYQREASIYEEYNETKN